MKKRRVVITGLGVIAACGGIGKEAFYKALTGKKSYVGPLTRFDCSTFPSKIAAEVKDFDPVEFMPRSLAEKLDRGTQFAIAVALMAVHDADLRIDPATASRTGISVGFAAGGYEFLERHFAFLKEHEWEKVPTNYLHAMSSSNNGGMVANVLKTRGPSYTISTGCTSGTEAIGHALRLIRRGDVDIMVAGGADAPIVPVTFGCFTTIKAMSTHNDEPERASRPFDKCRDGFVMSEGGALVVMEELEHAKKRNARIYCEVAGYGTTLNAYHITGAPTTGEDSARAMKLALADGAVYPDEVEYLSVHGSSTWLNEIAETNAAKTVFGKHARHLSMSSNKSIIGHPMGAAGGTQAAQIALSFERDFLSPTLNLDEPSPECDLDCIPWNFRRQRCDVMMHNSNGFSGKNAAVVYRRV